MNLKEKRALAVKKQEEILSKAKTEQRNLSDDEQALFNELQREIESLDIEIKNEELNERAIEDERTRCREIYSLCREFSIEPEEYIDSKVGIDEVRKEILDRLKRENKPINTGARTDVKVVAHGEDKFRAAVVDGLILRSTEIPLTKAAEGAKGFRNMRLKDIAIQCMSRQGEDVNELMRMSPDEIFNKITNERAYSSAEASFPAILDMVINKSYIEMYNHAPSTFDRFCKIGSLSDFKKHDNYYIAGTAGMFKEVPENGELVHDIPKDTKKPQRQLKTYGRQFTMSRKAFIDDDIGFITSLPGRYARAAKMTINKQVYEILFNNPAIYDGVSLFERDSHKNILTTGTAPTAEAINKMILALATQRDDFGEAISVSPSAIVVPVGYAMDIYKIFNSPSINTTDNTQAANPLYQLKNKIEVVEDATLNTLAGDSATPWFMFADKMDLNTIEVDFLNGQQTPTIRRMETSGVLGYTWDIFLDWGISVMDYRGVVKNKGIAIADPLA